MYLRDPSARHYGTNQLGWVTAVVTGVQAAKSAIKMDPKASAIKKKLDQFSVGKQLTKLIKGKGVSSNEKMWDEYKGIAGQIAGRDMPADAFKAAFSGMWETNRGDRIKALNAIRKADNTFEQQAVEAIAKAIASGQLQGTLTADQVASTVIFPVFDQMGVRYADYPAMRQIFVDLVDRILTEQEIGGNNPKLSVALQKYGTGTAASPAPPISTSPAAPVVSQPITQPGGPLVTVKTPPPVSTLPVPSPSVPGAPSAADIQQITDAIVSNMLQAGIPLAPTQSGTDAATAEILRYLQSAGVAPTQALAQSVQQQAAETIAEKKGGNAGLIVAGIAGVGLLYMLLRRKRR